MIKGGNKKKEMVGGYSRTRTYYFRRCKNSVNDCVPDEVLYEILLRLSAQDIFSAMLVCQKWYRMVCSNYKIFIRKHLEHSSYGLLCRTSGENVVFVYARKVGGGIDTIKLNYVPYPRYLLAWYSSNGLVLEADLTNIEKLTYYVRNVLSHRLFRLPQCPYPACDFEICVIGYDAASMKYKVVLPLRDTYTCCILTVGVDKSWRILSTDNLSDIGKTVVHGESVVTEGFIHWRRMSVNKVLTLNLETEIFVETTPIIECGNSFLSSGRYLTLFNRCKKFVWQVLEMDPETEEWKRLPNICLEGLEGKIKRLGINLRHYAAEPCGWLKYPELLALLIRSPRGDRIIFYNLNTCEVCEEMVPLPYFFYGITPYKNSLVRVGEF